MRLTFRIKLLLALIGLVSALLVVLFTILRIETARQINRSVTQVTERTHRAFTDLEDLWREDLSKLSRRLTESNRMPSALEAAMPPDRDPLAYFDPRFRVREDAELGCRLIRSGTRFILADDIVCYHRHPRDLRGTMERSYEVGYATAQLASRYPEVIEATKYLSSSALVNAGLLIAALALFAPAWLIRPLWPEALHRVVGGLLLHQRNRGYRTGCRDRQPEGRSASEKGSRG